MGGLFELEPALKTGRVFRILVIDDDRSGAEIFRRMMKKLHGRYELQFVWDGIDALQFLRRKDNIYQDALLPHLILLDINMPRLGGLETLSAIKSDPELAMIPVIMLSTSSSPDDVRASYQARANCFVKKPIDLERSVKLLEAIEAFWTDFVLLPVNHSGIPLATKSAEAASRAMWETDLLEKETETLGCGEHNRLLSNFGDAVRELLALHEQQFVAIVEGDGECARFDLLIHMANEHKQWTKYAYLRHVEAHGCSKT